MYCKYGFILLKNTGRLEFSSFLTHKYFKNTSMNNTFFREKCYSIIFTKIAGIYFTHERSLRLSCNSGSRFSLQERLEDTFMGFKTNSVTRYIFLKRKG